MVPPSSSSSSSNVLYDALHLFNRCVSILRGNSWWICCILMVLYILRDQVIKLYNKFFTGHALSSLNKEKKGSRSTDRQEQMRLARELQQERMNEQAKEAAKVRAEKEAAEKDRKNHCVVNKTDDEEKKKPKATGYNPMQPWTSSATPGRYRPARKTARRGG